MTFSPVARYVAPAVLILAAGTALVSVSNYSNAQSQPGTPSQTQPDRNQRDQNQRDQNQRDQNRPGTNQPGTPSDTDNTRRDNNRDNVDRSNMQPEDEDFFWRDDMNRDDQNRQGYISPFTFVSPQSQTGFNSRTQRLARMEDRLTQRTDELIRRLGEVRQMSPERRDEAMLDVMQQVLLDHRRLMLYLKQSRTAWSGDTSMSSATGEERNMPGMNPNNNNPNNPNTNPGNNPRSPR